MKRVLSATIFVLLFLLATFASYRVANAYVYSGSKWASNSATYDSHTLISSWNTDLSSARDQWNNVTPSPWAWYRDDTSNNDVTTGTIDGAGNTLATTSRTVSGSTITRMTILFDSAESWYVGSGTPGGTQIDLRSVAAHELGHGFGLSHTQSNNCPGNSTNATMCASYTPGTTYQRTLEADDKSGVNYIYP